MTEWHPATAMQKLNKVNSIELVFQVDTPTVASLKRDYGTAYAIDYLSIWLIRLNDRVNSANKLTSDQIKISAQDIILDYFQLTIADINIVFDRARKAKIYNRLDCNVISEWFESYWNERMEVAEMVSEGEYSKDTSDNTRSKHPEMVYLTAKELLNNQNK